METASKLSLIDRIELGIGKHFDSRMNFKANITLELRDKDGKLKEVRRVHNTVTTAGKYGVAEQMEAAPSLPKANWMEVGTGVGGVVILNAFIAASRTACTSVLRALAVVTYTCTFIAGVGTGAITECGLFDVVTANTANMWLYSSFAAINKAAGDSLTVTWTLTFS